MALCEDSDYFTDASSGSADGDKDAHCQRELKRRLSLSAASTCEHRSKRPEEEIVLVSSNVASSPSHLTRTKYLTIGQGSGKGVADAIGAKNIKQKGKAAGPFFRREDFQLESDFLRRKSQSHLMLASSSKLALKQKNALELESRCPLGKTTTHITNHPFQLARETLSTLNSPPDAPRRTLVTKPTSTVCPEAPRRYVLTTNLNVHSASSRHIGQPPSLERSSTPEMVELQGGPPVTFRKYSTSNEKNDSFGYNFESVQHTPQLSNHLHESSRLRPRFPEENHQLVTRVGERMQSTSSTINVSSSTLGNINKRLATDIFVQEKLTEESIRKAFSQECCNKFCLREMKKAGIRFARQRWFRQKSHEQAFSLQQMVFYNKVEKKWVYKIDSFHVCSRAFKVVLGVGPERIRRSKSKAAANPVPDVPKGRATSIANVSLQNWLTTFFNLHCDRMPDKDQMHLPAHFTKLEVFNLYIVDEVTLADGNTCAFSQFKKVWKKFFANVVIPKTNRFSTCSQCEHFKTLRKNSIHREERERGELFLERHLAQQRLERKKLEHHRNKSKKHPGKYMALVIDGMDQSKTNLPHWYRVPKSADPNCFIHLHLVGALVFNGQMSSRVFMTYPNFPNDGNLVITIIQTILREWIGPLPPVLYLQLDNTARENKNNLVLSYLHYLVAKKIFKKIKTNFLLVGHTHDYIDQMFSRFSLRLGHVRAFTLDQFVKEIETSYNPTPKMVLLEQVADFRSFALVEPSIIVNDMHNLSFSHAFKILVKTLNDKVPSQWSKRLSTDDNWEPEAGIQFLKDDYIEKEMLVIRGIPLRKKGDRILSTRGGASNGLHSAVEMETFLVDIEKGINALFQYFNVEEINWWKSFFVLQRTFNTKILGPVHPIPNFHLGTPIIVSPIDSTTIAGPSILRPTPEEMDTILFGPNRPTYVGAYKNPRVMRKEKERLEGDLKDLEVGKMICVPAKNCIHGRPFWIAKVEKIKTFVDHVPDNISILWYACSSEDNDPFTAKYREEFAPLQHCERTKKKGEKVPLHRQDIQISTITVFFYNFELSRSNKLFQSTVKIIKSKLEAFANSSNDSEGDRDDEDGSSLDGEKD